MDATPQSQRRSCQSAGYVGLTGVMADHESTLFFAFRDSTAPPAAPAVENTIAEGAMVEVVGVKGQILLAGSQSETTVQMRAEKVVEVGDHLAERLSEVREVVREGSETWIDAETKMSPRSVDLKIMI